MLRGLCITIGSRKSGSTCIKTPISKSIQLVIMTGVAFHTYSQLITRIMSIVACHTKVAILKIAENSPKNLRQLNEPFQRVTKGGEMYNNDSVALNKGLVRKPIKKGKIVQGNICDLYDTIH